MSAVKNGDKVKVTYTGEVVAEFDTYVTVKVPGATPSSFGPFTDRFYYVYRQYVKATPNRFLRALGFKA